MYYLAFYYILSIRYLILSNRIYLDISADNFLIINKNKAHFNDYNI